MVMNIRYEHIYSGLQILFDRKPEHNQRSRSAHSSKRDVTRMRGVVLRSSARRWSVHSNAKHHISNYIWSHLIKESIYM